MDKLCKNFAGLCLLAMLAVGFPAQARDIQPFENVTVFQEQVQLGLRTREVVYLRPTHQTVPGPAPVIVLLEFLRGSPVDMADVTEAGQLVRDYGAWVILPSSENGRWNYGITSFSQADDVGFLTGVINSAINRFPIDSHRVYMGGYSNGAEMTQRFICDVPGKVAAGLIVAGSIRSEIATGCNANVATPMVIFHGSNDHQIEYAGNLLYRGSVATAQFWGDIAGCSRQPTSSTNLPNVVDDGTTVHLDRYANCADNARIDHYTINGGGHTWPGSLTSNRGLGITSQEIFSTPLAWQFLTQFSRP